MRFSDLILTFVFFSFRLKKIAKNSALNDGNMKFTSQKMIDNVSNITNEQKKQVSNCHMQLGSIANILLVFQIKALGIETISRG